MKDELALRSTNMSSSSSDDTDDEDVVLVIDNGTFSTKAGFAGAKTVSCYFPTAIGVYNTDSDHSDDSTDDDDDGIIGEDLWRKEEESGLVLKRPIEKGIIKNFDDMEEIWEQIIYKELKVRTLYKEPFSVLLTESPLNPISNREKMAEIMFDKFNAMNVNIVMQHELGLIGNCRSTGVVVDSGDDVTNVVSIINGKPIKESITSVDIGGRDLSRYLQSSQRLCHLGWTDILKIKHSSLFYIPFDYNEEKRKFSANPNMNQLYQKHNGEEDVIEIGSELIQCPEILFKPSIINSDVSRIQQATIDSISKSPKEFHKELFGNICLVGGNTLFRGIAERLQAEISLLQPDVEVKVVAAPERIKSVWIGGSIMGSLESCEDRFVAKERFTEVGGSVFDNFYDRL